MQVGKYLITVLAHWWWYFDMYCTDNVSHEGKGLEKLQNMHDEIIGWPQTHIPILHFCFSNCIKAQLDAWLKYDLFTNKYFNKLKFILYKFLFSLFASLYFQYSTQNRIKHARLLKTFHYLSNKLSLLPVKEINYFIFIHLETPNYNCIYLSAA